jgi:hypothetical protein
MVRIHLSLSLLTFYPPSFLDGFLRSVRHHLEVVLYPDDTWGTCDGGQDYLSVDIVYSALDRHNAFFYL